MCAMNMGTEDLYQFFFELDREKSARKFAIKYWNFGLTPVYDENGNEVIVTANSAAEALDEFFAEHNIPYEDMDAMFAVEIKEEEEGC